MSLQVDGLNELRAGFRSAAMRVIPETRAVVARGALNIKNGMAEDARLAAPIHAPHFPRSISYDDPTVGSDGSVSTEIGPDKDRAGAQGGLGNLLAFGSRNNAPVWDHAAALEREADPFERYIGEAVERLLR